MTDSSSTSLIPAEPTLRLGKVYCKCILYIYLEFVILAIHGCTCSINSYSWLVMVSSINGNMCNLALCPERVQGDKRMGQKKEGAG